MRMRTTPTDLSRMLQLSSCLGFAPVCVIFELLRLGDVIARLCQDLVNVRDGANGLVDLDRETGDGRRVQVHRGCHALKMIRKFVSSSWFWHAICQLPLQRAPELVREWPYRPSCICRCSLRGRPLSPSHLATCSWPHWPGRRPSALPRRLSPPFVALS